jgi:uncharacterized protein (TIGR03067 family)
MRRVLPLLAVLLIGFAPAPAPKGDLWWMRGEWTTVRCLIDGKELPEPEKAFRSVVEGGRMRFFLLGCVQRDWAVRVDEGKTPRVMHRTASEGAHSCIYRLEGETLHICYWNQEVPAPPPVDFVARKGVSVEVLKRAKR